VVVGVVAATGAVAAILRWLHEAIPALQVVNPRAVRPSGRDLDLTVANAGGTAHRYLIVVHAGDGIYSSSGSNLPKTDGTVINLQLWDPAQDRQGAPLHATRLQPLILLARDKPFRRWWYCVFDQQNRGSATYRWLRKSKLQRWLDDTCSGLRIPRIPKP
jgi:hypothetical protein